uniref:NADP-dependent oxidoreductase domain-containing protein n=1 Tax=Cannabis sativa TaxID=3483 RepID=A0A803NTR3_CANSA
MGYRHFDTAKIYGSEPAVGNALMEAISDRRVEREDLFVTSKLWGSDHHDPVSGLKQTLRNLSMEYLDLYLVHWPVTLKPWARFAVPNEDEFEKLDLESTWAGMQKCLELAVNQVEMHPMWRQAKLREVCGDHKIHVSAYSPLGGPGNSWGSTAVIDHPTIQSIAKERKATPPQEKMRGSVVPRSESNANKGEGEGGLFELHRKAEGGGSHSLSMFIDSPLMPA